MNKTEHGILCDLLNRGWCYFSLSPQGSKLNRRAALKIIRENPSIKLFLDVYDVNTILMVRRGLGLVDVAYGTKGCDQHPSVFSGRITHDQFINMYQALTHAGLKAMEREVRT